MDKKIRRSSKKILAKDNENSIQKSNRQNTESLRESDSKFRGFIENLPVMFYAVEPSAPYTPIYISRAFELFGYPVNDWYEKSDMWLRVIHPDDCGRVLGETNAAIKAGSETDYEYRVIGKDGTLYWVRDRGCFIRDKQGEAICWQGIIIDITKRKQAEEALTESEVRYRALFENANDLIYIHDLAGNYLAMNEAAGRVFGYTPEEIPALNIKEIVAPEHLKIAKRMLAKKMRGGGQTAYELDCITKGGKRLTLELSSSPICRDGIPIAVQGIARDITGRKLAEMALHNSEAELRALFAAMTDIILVLDKEGKYLKVAPTNPSLLYKPADELVGKMLHEIFDKEQADYFLWGVREALEKRASVRLEYDLNAGDRAVCFTAIVSPMMDDTVVFVARDITERKQAEQALIQSEEQYRDLFENANDLIYTHDLKGNFTSINRAGEVITGFSREEALRMNISQVVAPEFLESARAMTMRKVSGEAPTAYELEIIAKDGHRVSLELSTRLIMHNERPVGVQGIGRDITARKRAEEKLKHYALHDTLTGLPNRAHFMNYLQTAIERAAGNSQARFAVLFLDLDRFKVINDSLGHIIGDKLLVAIAERLKSCVRPGDVVARLGGDEFTILLNRTGEVEDVAGVAERLQKRLSQPFKLHNYEVFTSASIGIIVSDEVTRQPDDFLRDADAAMYRAKESGKARYEIFDSAMHVRNMNLLKVETDLRHAVERGEFEVFYQPIISLESGEVREFEALIRWNHPQHGLIMPNEFICVAEETGLIISMGKWILEEACRQTSEWQKRFPSIDSLSISVNLSAKQLMHPSLTAQVSEILERTRLKARFLKLEVTESTVMENADTALGVLSDLHKLGISLSTDDFGTGYSSLSYLHRFPFERLKIDRSFISKMEQDDKCEAIVRTILMLGQNLNIETVAEGIETEKQLERLQLLGCPFGQGFLFSKPVNAAAAERLLQEGLPLALDSMFGFSTGQSQILEVSEIH
ncbi:MAG: PAS domain S-box protein [Pyrinomonadaceae bacterium]